MNRKLRLLLIVGVLGILGLLDWLGIVPIGARDLLAETYQDVITWTNPPEAEAAGPRIEIGPLQDPLVWDEDRQAWVPPDGTFVLPQFEGWMRVD